MGAVCQSNNDVKATGAAAKKNDSGKLKPLISINFSIFT